MSVPRCQPRAIAVDASPACQPWAIAVGAAPGPCLCLVPPLATVPASVPRLLSPGDCRGCFTGVSTVGDRRACRTATVSLSRATIAVLHRDRVFTAIARADKPFDFAQDIGRPWHRETAHRVGRVKPGLGKGPHAETQRRKVCRSGASPIPSSPSCSGTSNDVRCPRNWGQQGQRTIDDSCHGPGV